jgi:hypothetical protein
MWFHKNYMLPLHYMILFRCNSLIFVHIESCVRYILNYYKFSLISSCMHAGIYYNATTKNIYSGVCLSIVIFGPKS